MPTAWSVPIEGRSSLKGWPLLDQLTRLIDESNQSSLSCKLHGTLKVANLGQPTMHHCWPNVALGTLTRCTLLAKVQGPPRHDHTS
jgi:hypothetical protein